MDKQRSSVEVFVPKGKAWWALLALSANFPEGIPRLRFVREASGRGRALYIDAALVSSLPQSLYSDIHVTVILWDGYQSYLEYKDAINGLGNRVRALEIRAVGDPSEWVKDSYDSEKCGLLFPQCEQLYGTEMLGQERLRMFSFSDPFFKAQIRYRPTLISSKVAMQLLLGARRAEYERTQYVFCGQSGMETLAKYSDLYGTGLQRPLVSDSGLRCDEAFVVGWIAAVQRNRAHWTNSIVRRALLRLMALRALYGSRRNEIFMNVFPAANINAYQASMLFRRHVFLEFGGICGDELIYPRTADIAFLGRKMLRFNRVEAIQKMMQLDYRDVAGLSSFAKWYDEQVTSTLDRSSSLNPPYSE